MTISLGFNLREDWGSPQLMYLHVARTVTRSLTGAVECESIMRSSLVNSSGNKTSNFELALIDLRGLPAKPFTERLQFPLVRLIGRETVFSVLQ